MHTRLFGISALALVALTTGLARAVDINANPPVVQAITSASGPVQAYRCVFEGTPNGAVRATVKVRNRSAKTLTGVTIRYRWYDESGAKIFDNVAAVPTKLDSDERGVVAPPNGFGDANGNIRRITCAITQAQFGDGSTWVAGKKYHGKLLPAAFTEDASAAK